MLPEVNFLTSIFCATAWGFWSSVVLDILIAHRHRGDLSEQRKLLFVNTGIDRHNSLFGRHLGHEGQEVQAFSVQKQPQKPNASEFLIN